ncbi:Maf family protein [Bosea sp. 117]|uniref:Maf family protein n=1 Tax=Bosea sp. 117 TaxID=1125973 RepID=UPI00068BDCE6|nr:Maf family protein [Bosea sp. 117]
MPSEAGHEAARQETPSGLWTGAAPLILASKSATRRALLEAARVPFEVAPVDVDERGLEAEALAAGANAAIVAATLARAKARAASRTAPGRLVVGADQTLSLGQIQLHKPVDREAARAQLAQLAGRTHALLSAVAVARDDLVLFETVEVAYLTMRPLDAPTLEAYLDAAGDAVLGSVGAYQLEGLGIHLFTRIEGDHSVILGLPLLPLLAFLRTEGVLK